jgi:hypothetical protein
MDQALIDPEEVMESPVSVEAQDVPPEDDEIDPTESERRQVCKFLADTRAPTWMEAAFRRCARDREYLNKEVFAEDDDSKVTVAQLLRSIYAKLASVWPENPEAVVKPGEEVEPEMTDPIYPFWQARRDYLDKVAKTASVLHRKWTKESCMQTVLRKAALSTFTVGMTWLKTGWEEDANRGALGQSVKHSGTGRDQMLKLRDLSRRYASGDFDDDSTEYQDLVDLSDWVRAQASVKMQSMQVGDPRQVRLLTIANTPPGQPVPLWTLPEPETWQGPTVDVIDFEDVRFDWNRVTSPSLCHRGRFWNHRVWMHRDEASRRFKLTKDERTAIGAVTPFSHGEYRNLMLGTSASRENREDPASTELEAQTRANGEEVAIWERWDLENGMVYQFALGVERMLSKQIIDTVTKRGHPFIPVFFNEVDGTFMPISDTRFGRKTQDCMNQALTDDWEARIAAYPFYAIAAGMLTAEDKAAIEQGRRAHRVVELSRPVEDIRMAMQSIKGEEYHPERYQIAINQMSQLMERLVGAPVEASGGQGKPEFASQMILMQQAMNVASGRVAKLLIECMTQIYEDWNDFALVALPEESAKKIAGMAAQWPSATRDEIRACMVVEIITAGVRGMRKADLEDLQVANQVLQGAMQTEALAAQLGYQYQSDVVGQRVAAALDLRVPGGLLRKQASVQQAMINAQGQAGGQPGAPAAPGAPIEQQASPLAQLNPAAAQVTGGGA